jgi:hypothetical protein
MLDEIIDYVKFLQLQVKVCWPPPSLCFTLCRLTIAHLLMVLL